MTTWYVDLFGGTDTLQTKSITGATKANPCVITSAGHGYQNGQVIVITGVAGMTQLNGYSFTVANVALNTYELSGIDSTGYGAYTTGGTSTINGRIITNITQANPCVVTCVGHGYSNSDFIFINDVGGMTELNGKCFTVANKATDTFELLGIDSTGYSAWTYGGTTQRAFLTPNGSIASASPGDEIRISSTTAPTQYTTSNLTWTNNSNVVGTSASLVGVIAVGDYIGRINTMGNGSVESAYRVLSLTASAINLESKYYGETGTDTASVYKLNLFTLGAVNSTSITINKNITMSGGWNLTTSVQNGETWIKSNGVRTSSATKVLYISSVCSVNKINLAETYTNNFVAGASGSTISYCSFLGTTIYGFTTTASEITFSNCRFNGTSGNYGCVYLDYANSNIYFPNTVIGGFTSGICFTSAQSGLTIYGGTFVNTSTGIYFNNANLRADGVTIINCLTGISVTGLNSFINNCNISGAVQGIVIGANITCFLITGCNITNCSTYGISIYQSRGGEVSGCTFTTNTIDVAFDQYSSQTDCINNAHNYPSTWAYSRQLVTGTNNIFNCTIDGASISKAFQIVVGSSYQIPQWILHNSFGGQYGSYYSNGQITKDATVYRSVGPSLRIAYNTTLSVVNSSLKIVSCYAKSNQSKKFSLYMKRDSVDWTGTIVPQFKLDGMTITTETTITSLTTDWVLYEWTCPAASIVTDGELSMTFRLNANSTAIWIDDFTVTDI